MKFKEHPEIPSPLLKMLTENREPTPYRYGVNELIGPPRISQLRRRHWQEIEADPIDNVWMLFGKLLHSQLESRVGDQALVEEKIVIDLLDRKIAGVPDHYEDGVLTDYKFCSVYVANDIRPEWVSELNFHAHLLRSCGFEVTKLQICMVFRDWSATKSENDPNYAPRIKVVQVPRFMMGEVAFELEKRLKIHIANEQLPDQKLYECTDQERWASPESWAVFKNGGKRATKVFRAEDGETKAQAVALATAIGGTVEDRPKEYKRCALCEVREFCNQWKTPNESPK